MKDGRNVYRTEMLLNWGLEFAAIIYLTFQGISCGWPKHVYLVLWIQLLVLTVCTFVRKVSFRIQAVVFATVTLLGIFISGFYIWNYQTIMVLFLAGMVMISLYHSPWLSLYGALLFIPMIIYYIHIGKIQLGNVKIAWEFRASVIIFVGITVVINLIHVKEKRTRKRLEEAAVAAQAAERSKSDFLANMSHEIRTPMNAIVGMCELALREQNLSDNVKEYCYGIQNSGRSLLAIINDILDFSKIESGKMELIEDEFNIASTMNDVINMAMTRMGDKPIEIIVNGDPDIPQGLLGDEIRIRQLMINLMTNAVKYTRSGIIKLSVSQTQREYGINLNFRVEDSGIGISPENLEKLFESFQQVDTRKNRSEEGTGLGLAITKRLLNQMGGFINVESEYGKGSVFSFVIPLRVCDKTPFVNIHEAETFQTVGYMDESKIVDENVKKEYVPFLTQLGECLDIDFQYFNDFERFKEFVENRKVTHCFTGKEEYLAHKDFFDMLGRRLQMVIIQNRKHSIITPPGMKCVYKPFYALSIASILNNESMIACLDMGKSITTSFVAPKARVLIVDDNVVNLQVAVGLMQPYHMQVLTTESGKEAIRVLASKDFDLVFMDHMMPEMDGVETTQIIRSREEEYFKKLPIIALTANAVNGAREMFLEHGFQGFLAKPIELSSLDRILKQYIPVELQERDTMNEKDMNSQREEQKVEQSEQEKALIDVETGLVYTGHNRDAYLSILGTYVKKGKEKCEVIRSLYTQEDWKNYIIEVHALKSSSLAVGAKILSEKAKELELRGKSGDYGTIREKNDALLELYAQVLEAGMQIMEKYQRESGYQPEQQMAQETECETITKEQLEQLVSDISDAADSFDVDAIMELAKKAENYQFADVPLWDYAKKMEESADEFEYDQVTAVANLMLKEIGEKGA